jgi:UDP-N-acetyl-D-glucosamine dehydrogenase
MKKLETLIKNKTAKISIIGLGYVGLPLAIKFSSLGFEVYGFEKDQNKIQDLNKSKIYVDTIKKDDFIKVKNKKFKYSSNKAILSKCDIHIICVPTPITQNKTPDMTYLNDSRDLISEINLTNKAIILESTTYPGTTEELFLPLLKKKKLKIGKNVALIYSPERIDPGNKKFSVENTPKIVSGYTKTCLKIAENIYKNITQIVPVTNIKTAEFTKILENVYRSINIGFVNEMKMISEKLEIDIFEVIDAAKTKPFGYVPFYPGPGLGGHCIPVDPYLLSWKAKELNINTRFIELSGEINNYMPEYVVTKINQIISQNNKKINDSKILILGVSYKKDSPDTRETPSIKIINNLKKQGFDVFVSDKFCSKFYLKKNKLKNINLNAKNISNFDCVVIVTDHSYFDYSLIEKKAKLIVDCRGRIKNINKSKIRA